MIELRVASSDEVLREFEDGRVDAALVLRHDSVRRDGEAVMKERFGWFAAPGWSSPRRIRMPMSWTTAPCKPRRGYVRAFVIR